MRSKMKGSLCVGCDRLGNFRCSTSLSGPADVLLVGGQPDEVSARTGLPMNGPEGRIVRNAVLELRTNKRYSLLRPAFTYAVQCEDETAPNPPKKVMAQCSTYLETTIAATRPKLIVALGASAMRQLGFKHKHKDARGRMYSHFKYGIPTLVTFSERALMATPGLYPTFKLDLKNGYERILQEEERQHVTIDTLSKTYDLPQDADAAIELCDYIIKYTEQGDAAKWAISIDTETTTLHAHKLDAKIIALCCGWAAGKSATILLDHPHVDEAYAARLPAVWAAVRRLLESNKPKILHNAKFDLKFIENAYGMKVKNVAWCTLLGEHLLDEDKKGNYGLKALTAGWLPKYCGYEDHLHDLLTGQENTLASEAVTKEIADQRAVLEEHHPELLADLEVYRTALHAYEIKLSAANKEMAAYSAAMEDYVFNRAMLAGLQAAWKVEVQGWPKGKRGKPKKPVKWFTKPAKPTLPKKPKAPVDLRSKKEKQISKDAGFEAVPLHDLQVYGAIDADVTRQLARIQRQRVVKEESSVHKLMPSHAVPASRVLGTMEFEGIRVDRSYMESLRTALSGVVERTDIEIYDMAGRTKPDGSSLNLNHAATLANVLYNWGWTHPDGTRMAPYPIVELTKKKQPSTAEKTLRPFVDYEDDDETIPVKSAYFIERLLQNRKASKALNTFLANVDVLSRRDGFLHSIFHLNGTGTGRLSSSDMNLQNFPKWLAGWNIKKLLVADSSDYVVVNVDYKGAEVRVFTAYAPDKNLIDALNDGMDMHSYFSHNVYSRPYDDYALRDSPDFTGTKEYSKLLDNERKQIKRVVFGILYGAGAHKIAESIGVSLEEAKALIRLLYDKFPALEIYAIDIAREVAQNQFVETKFGRRRRFPLAKISRHRSRAVRQARNFKIQSTSSDIVIAQMVEINEPLRREYGGRMLLTVHDSLCFQFPRNRLSELKDFVQHYTVDRVRQKFPWLPVPFSVDVEVGENYGECINVDKFLARQPAKIKQEGVVTEHEILTELREDAFYGN